MAKSSNKLKMGHFVRFLVQKRTIKFSFEIYWPLRSYWKCIPECTKNLTMKYTSKHLIIVYFCIYMGCLYDWLLIFDFGFRENSLPFFVNNWSSQRIAGEKLNLLRVIKTMNYSVPVSNIEWTITIIEFKISLYFFIILQKLLVKIVLRYPASYQSYISQVL